MSQFSLKTELPAGITGISNLFLDYYMPKANGEYVKVYLYLLRALSLPSKDLSVTALADALDHTEGDILRALKYWEKQQLLRLEYSSPKELQGIWLLKIPAPDDVTEPLNQSACRASTSTSKEKILQSRRTGPVRRPGRMSAAFVCVRTVSEPAPFLPGNRNFSLFLRSAPFLSGSD